MHLFMLYSHHNRLLSSTLITALFTTTLCCFTISTSCMIAQSNQQSGSTATIPEQTEATPTANIPTKIISGKIEIPIGASLPLKGEISIIGSAIFDGMSLLFNKIKQEKSDLGFAYALTALDDQSNIPKTRKNIKKLSKLSPLFISPLGTDIVAGILPDINKNHMSMIFPLDGAQEHRKPELKNIAFFRAHYEEEIDALVNYSINTLTKKKIALFYEASTWGECALATFNKVLEKHKLKAIALASYPQHSLNISKAAAEIAAKAPDAIICIAHARPAYNFIRQIINKGLYQTAFLGLSQMISVQKPLKLSRGVEIITSSVVPDPTRSKLAIAEEFRADMKKYFPNKTLSPFAFEGYINAALLTECTKLVSPPFTTEKIIAAIENLKHVRFKGLSLSFDSETRTLSKSVWINAGDDTEWIAAKKQPVPKDQS